MDQLQILKRVKRTEWNRQRNISLYSNLALVCSAYAATEDGWMIYWSTTGSIFHSRTNNAYNDTIIF